MALIDIDYFRRQPLGAKAISNLSSEVLEETIQEASDYVEDYLDRKILEATYIERIVGQRDWVLMLDNYPITELTDVSYDGLAGDVGTHSTGDFLIHSDAGFIEWINKMYNFRGDRVYTVTYKAGYTEVPSPIRRAVALQTVQLLRPMYGGQTDSAQEIVPFADELITSLLEKYRRKRIS
jgi:hypothetical protein